MDEKLGTELASKNALSLINDNKCISFFTLPLRFPRNLQGMSHGHLGPASGEQGLQAPRSESVIFGSAVLGLRSYCSWVARPIPILCYEEPSIKYVSSKSSGFLKVVGELPLITYSRTLTCTKTTFIFLSNVDVRMTGLNVYWACALLWRWGNKYRVCFLFFRGAKV